MLAECGVDRVGSLNETPNEEIQGKVDKVWRLFVDWTLWCMN